MIPSRKVNIGGQNISKMWSTQTQLNVISDENYGGIERATAVASTRSARLLYNRASSEAPQNRQWTLLVVVISLRKFFVLCQSSEDIFIMSDAAATPAKAPKKKSAAKAKKPSSHPKYSKMIKDALTALKVR